VVQEQDSAVQSIVYDSCGIVAENRIASFINFENKQMVQATGALLNQLLNGRKDTNMLETLEADQSGTTKIRLHSIETLQLEDYMQIDSVTFNALQIFNLETHPSGSWLICPSALLTVLLIAWHCSNLKGRWARERGLLSLLAARSHTLRHWPEDAAAMDAQAFNEPRGDHAQAGWDCTDASAKLAGDEGTNCAPPPQDTGYRP
jgi:hypothetical protein